MDERYKIYYIEDGKSYYVIMSLEEFYREHPNAIVINIYNLAEITAFILND